MAGGQILQTDKHTNKQHCAIIVEVMSMVRKIITSISCFCKVIQARSTL